MGLGSDRNKICTDRDEHLFQRCVPQAGIEPTFSRPQRDALTTGLSGPKATQKRTYTYRDQKLISEN